METIQPGLTAEKTATVTETLTARHMGSGSIDVYATPAMIALMEAAAVAAIDPLLPEGKASVGGSIEVQHLAATPLGQQVRARAEVVEVEGKRVAFAVRAWDEGELIGEGMHTRYVIDVARFIKRTREKARKP